MRFIRPALGIFATLAVVVLFNAKLGPLPPLGRFIDPFAGVWQNAEPAGALLQLPGIIPGLQGEVKVVFDDRDVPHIFASNNHDLYLAQGYVTAMHRLWQMETQTRAAAGRLAEVVGPSMVDFDLKQRRKGMVWAAERALQEFESDPLSSAVVQAYTDGVNAFIRSIDQRNLPLEYRLLDYRPEPWSPLKSTLLLKYMADMLSGTEQDLANTEALKLFGGDLFGFLYPEQHRLEDPIAPGFSPDTSVLACSGTAYLDAGDFNTINPQPRYLGSNNWAVSGSRTASGNPILCNDPHLSLGLPSIWYEIQLHAPGINSYGVSLPGSPGIIIGFNEKIAWGVTNAGRDVRDYFAIEFENDFRKRYLHGDEWRQTDFRVERVNVRGAHVVIDSVPYTHHGPIISEPDGTGRPLAMRWTAHDPSNEMMTFHKLNRALGYEDYLDAIKHFQCPGQNFVFADIAGNIAIWQQGRFPLRPIGHGRFVLDGTDMASEVHEYIPQGHNPHLVNPERGFVSSANQAPTDTTYPYYYSGVFEEFRNRTINRALRADSTVTFESMRALQLNNLNLLAEEALPVMLGYLDTLEFQNKRTEMMALYTLLTWDNRHDRGIIGPTAFQIWWDELNNLIYDELNDPKWMQEDYYQHSWEEFERTGRAKLDMRDKRYMYPTEIVTLKLIRDFPDHPIFDHASTPDKVETAHDLMYDSFYWMAMKLSDIISYHIEKPHWGHYQGTRVNHLLRQDALSSPKLFVGGHENAPNAMTPTHGPSWRMIVELTPDGPEAYGVLPGGQSGNPGSHSYLQSLPLWARGEYHKLHFMRGFDEELSGNGHIVTITGQP